MTRPLPLPAWRRRKPPPLPTRPPPLPAKPPPLPASAFDWTTRVLCCAECGAPLEAALAGGLVRCAYCRVTNLIERRERRPHRSARRLPRPALQEAERIDRLRSQIGVELESPYDVRPYVAAGMIQAGWASHWLSNWLSTHKRVRQNKAAFDADRLFHLTLLLAPRVDPRTRRALLETALEALILPRHQQLLRGELARGAALEGNVAAAVSWLAPCDPYAADLHMDSAYRIGAAYIAAARDDRAQILALLGGLEGEVPIAPERVDEAEVLRIHACERLVGVTKARARLRAHLDSPLRLGGMLRVLRDGRRIGLCGRAWPPLELFLFERWEEKLRAAPDPVPLWVAMGCLVAAVVYTGAMLLAHAAGLFQLGAAVAFGALLATVAIASNHDRLQHLCKFGKLGVAHLCTAEAPDYHASVTQASETHRFNLEVAIETDDGPVRVVVRRSIFPPAPRGSSPVLYDAAAPYNCRVLVEGTAADSFEVLRPLLHPGD